MKFKILNDDIGGRFKAGEIGDLDLEILPMWDGKYHCCLDLGPSNTIDPPKREDIVSSLSGFGIKFPESALLDNYRRLFFFHFWEVEPILHPYVVTLAEEIVKKLCVESRVETLRSRQHIASSTDALFEDEPELIEAIKEVMGDQYISDDDFAEQMNEAIFRQIIKRIS